MTVKDNELIWAKVKPDAIIPTKRDEDAGYDIYPCFEEDYIIIPPHETKMIPTGIASAFTEDYVAILKERGSTGTKGIAQRSGVIDSGFRSEWQCPITNTNTVDLIISKLTIEELIKKYATKDEEGYQYMMNGSWSVYLTVDEEDKEDLPIIHHYEKAICQAILLPVPKMKTSEISYDELKSIPSERGVGMLGSSLK